MHRLNAIVILLFWAIMFGGLAHVSLAGFLTGAEGNGTDLQLLLSSAAGYQLMPVMMMIVAALFGWAILALVTTDFQSFREVETYAYATAIIVMCACTLLAFAKFGTVTSLPAIFTSALCVCLVASKQLMPDEAPTYAKNKSRALARQMALSAAHNSLLSRLSGRAENGTFAAKVTQFPLKSRTDSTTPGGEL